MSLTQSGASASIGSTVWGQRRHTSIDAGGQCFAPSTPSIFACHLPISDSSPPPKPQKNISPKVSHTTTPYIIRNSYVSQPSSPSSDLKRKKKSILERVPVAILNCGHAIDPKWPLSARSSLYKCVQLLYIYTRQPERTENQFFVRFIEILGARATRFATLCCAANARAGGRTENWIMRLKIDRSTCQRIRIFHTFTI